MSFEEEFERMFSSLSPWEQATYPELPRGECLVLSEGTFIRPIFFLNKKTQVLVCNGASDSSASKWAESDGRKLRKAEALIRRAICDRSLATCFPIAPNIVLVARHLLSSSESVFLSNDQDQLAHTDPRDRKLLRHIKDFDDIVLPDPNILEGNDARYTEYQRFSVDGFYSVSGRNCPLVASDFVFMTTSSPIFDEFFIPSSVAPQVGDDVAVAGYPEQIDGPECLEKNISVSAVIEHFGGLSHKAISVGQVKMLSPRGLCLGYDASTLSGFCGGPIMLESQPELHFCGFHAHCSLPGAQINWGISVHSPIFVIKYAAFVVNKLPQPLPKSVKEYIHQHEDIIRKFLPNMAEDILRLIH